MDGRLQGQVQLMIFVHLLAPDRAASKYDLSLEFVSSVLQKLQGQVNILKKEKYSRDFLGLLHCVIQVLVPYGVTDENSYVCTKSLRFRSSVHMGISNSIVINPLSELDESSSL